MRVRLFLLTFIFSLPLLAVSPKPTNLGFEEGKAGWSIQAPAGYESAVVPESHSGTSALKLWSVSDKPADVIPAIQAIDAAPYRGKFVRLRAWVRSEVASSDAAANLFLRVDRPNGAQGFFDNSMDRPIRNPQWASYEILGQVADDAVTIVFGSFFHGRGAAWVDDVEIVDVDTIAPASEVAAKYLDKALAIMEKNSLRRNFVDWEEVRSRSQMYARGATTPADTYPAIRYSIRELGDHHSFFRPPAAAKDWRSAGASQPQPEVKIIEENVGYIGVPGYDGADPAAINAYITDIQAQIARADSAARCGWIVDLRNNSGGNMWPMLSALGPIIRAGELLSLVAPAKPPAVVIFKDGRANAGSGSAAKSKSAESTASVRERAPAVAVLTSQRTGSSGEAVTIAFRGRPRTRSFGAPTAGVSTGNETFTLDDGAMILLTTTVMADRTGQLYGHAVWPDIEVNGDAETLAAASRWLRKESDCAR